VKYLSVCAGIEAATVAWHHMGWTPAAFSEIEPFPSAVLAHHYPQTPNLGDMTRYKEWHFDSIDLLVGGTPCQSFSVAGLRKGLDDPRGNLMLTFGSIAQRYQPQWLVWENVPGVLSSNSGRDFGTFLGMLGELGYGFAYRVLDAQYFGVAQRRRRVFVVGCLGSWQRAAAVLFDSKSLSGNLAPSREKGKATARGATAGTGSSHSEPVGAQSSGADPHTVATLCATDAAKWGSNQWVKEGKAILQSVAQPVAIRTANTSANGHGISEELAHTLDRAQGQAVAYDILGVPATNGAKPTDVHTPLRARLPGQSEASTTTVIAQPVNIYGGNKRTDRPNGGFYVRMDENISKTLDAASGLNPTCSQGGTAVMQAVAFGIDQELNAREELAGTLQRKGQGGFEGSVATAMQVRRLTPVECERLQGFPDGYTAIAYRNKPASECPDGPRYKALGNSMAVPVMRWIGERIQIVSDQL
jgi:DNA (cytosine-5)-methyltransferase 1